PTSPRRIPSPGIGSAARWTTSPKTNSASCCTRTPCGSTSWTRGEGRMQLTHGLISVDDHVQEHPEVWTSRLQKGRWGDRIPHVETLADGSERWVADGVARRGVGSAGAACMDRAIVLAREQC